MSPAAAQADAPPGDLKPKVARAINGPPPRPPRRGVCFSFAAYAKTVIHQLRSCGVQVARGLTDAELEAVESAHAFRFPPDLRSILHEGLPLGPGFPDWRCASPQQLQILLTLPSSSLVAAVSRGLFWCTAWGSRPLLSADATAVAKNALAAAPTLVPVYRNHYVPAAPNLAGNPVIYVQGPDVRCAGLDLTDFFRRQNFGSSSTSPAPPLAPKPAWAAKSARIIEVWTDVVEQGIRGGFGWTTTESGESVVGKCLEEVGWKLRDGGWREDDVREMLMMGEKNQGLVRPQHLTLATGDSLVAGLRDSESVAWHVRLLGLALLRAGWSVQDVAYCVSGGPGDTTTTTGGGPGEYISYTKEGQE